MSLKAGNFSFHPRTAKKLLLIGKNGTNLEPGGSQEAPGTAQSSIHPLIAVLELILGSLTVASGNLTEGGYPGNLTGEVTGRLQLDLP